MYPKEYIEYLIHFHGDRDYFECHELLEEYWKTSTDQKKDSIWVGLILFAVSNYHHRRGNFQGAIKTLNKSLSILLFNKNQLRNLGIDADHFLLLVSKKISDLLSYKPYESMNIPLIDPLLINECSKTCLERGVEWGKKSDLTNETILHRHFRRDRSSVINERLIALQKRKNKGSDSNH